MLSRSWLHGFNAGKVGHPRSAPFEGLMRDFWCDGYDHGRLEALPEPEEEKTAMKGYPTVMRTITNGVATWEVRFPGGRVEHYNSRSRARDVVRRFRIEQTQQKDKRLTAARNPAA